MNVQEVLDALAKIPKDQWNREVKCIESDRKADDFKKCGVVREVATSNPEMYVRIYFWA